MNRVYPRRAKQDGTTLIIALLVIVIMASLGAVFISLISRNIRFAERGRESLTEQYFAEAGIRFAVNQLSHSEEGADWRPQPDNLDMTQPLIARDPDAPFLMPYSQADQFDNNGVRVSGPSGGFTRIAFGKGRSLVRVSYQPQLNDPFSHMIKIESVGRVGEVDANDPTTFINDGPLKRRVLVAYVQIGLADYLRFVMNHDRRATPTEVGADEIGLVDPQNAAQSITPTIVYGLPQAAGAGWGGAPMRFNTDVRFRGNVQMFVNPDFERVEVAGSIDVPGLAANGTPSVTLNGVPVYPSNRQQFSTHNGLIRDASARVDPFGYPRSAAYLEPPRMDVVDPASGQNRYIALTRASGRWRQDFGGNWYNTGRDGYGRGIYINNTGDIQQESGSLVGGYSMRSDWLNPGRSPFWNGAFYTPPGAYVELIDRADVNPLRAKFGMVVTRNQSNNNDTWREPVSGRRTNIKTLGFWFRAPNDRFDPRIYNDFTRNQPNQDVEFNGVIYLEGNVRIRGTIPRGRQITIVTNGTAYIEGNLLKGDAFSSLAIIAKDHVCLNTTQFLSKLPSGPAVAVTDPLDSDAPFHFSTDANTPLDLSFSFGVDPTTYDTFNTYGVRYLTRHSGASVASLINLLINPGVDNSPLNDFYLFNLPNFAPNLYVLQNQASQIYPRYERGGINLLPPTNNYAIYVQPGWENLLRFQLDPTVSAPSGNQNYFFSTGAVVPNDWVVQAALYAQNGSFFVIPGHWHNTNTDDTRANFAARGTRPLGVLSPDVPFYGEPLDIKITIEGAIAENTAASLHDQSEWLKRWGWIPLTYGNSGQEIPSTHQQFMHHADYAANLFMRYDRTWRRPFSNTVTPEPLRIANFPDPSGTHPGRLLPAAPKLPVCPKPVYVGEDRR